MKYIAFSFDDGRSDTYEVAKPIMEKYGLRATVNVISGFVLHPDMFRFQSAPKGMTAEQVVKWQIMGGEIASHGSAHKNSGEEIINSIDELKSIDVDVNGIGFASPESWLTEANSKSSGIEELRTNGTVSYLRSGVQIRREGILYTGLSIVERVTHSKWLYYHLNKRNIIKCTNTIYPSAAVKDYTTLQQLQAYVNKLEDNDSVIFMFHSILQKDDPSYGADHYYWDAGKFESLCGWLKNRDDISVVTVKELIRRIEG